MENSPGTRPIPSARGGKLAAIVVVLLLIVLLAIFFRSGAASGPSAASLDPVVAQAQVLGAVERQRAALGEVALRAARDEGHHVLRMIDGLAEARAAWDSEIKALLQNDDGRLIAADMSRVARFAALMRLTLPEPEQIAQQRERFRRLLVPAEDALSGKIAVFSPDHAYLQLLDQERGLAEQRASQLTEYRRMLATLVAEAKEAAASPASLPLSAKVEQHERETAARRLQALQEARDRAEAENTALLAELEKRKLGEIGEAERKRREAELDAQRIEQETLARAVAERAERDRLRTLAQNEEVQKRYQVFLAKGRYSFGDDKIVNGPSCPASYNALRRAGILSDLREFARAVTGTTITQGSLAMTAFYVRNDRPHWQGYPQTDKEWASMNPHYSVRRGKARVFSGKRYPPGNYRSSR